MPFEPGNQLAANPRKWRDAINAALELKSRVDQKDALQEVANTLIHMAIAGDMNAIKELGNRLDGQAVAITDHKHSGLTIVIQQGLADQSDALVIDQPIDSIEKLPVSEIG